MIIPRLRRSVSCVTAILVVFLVCASGRICAEKQAPSAAGELLYAVSMRRVLNQLHGPESEAASRLAWMTTPVGLFVDEGGDVILVGRSDPGDIHLTVDDLTLAYRNRRLGDPAKSIGISIDPPGHGRKLGLRQEILQRSLKWSVTYSGRDFAGTRMALAYFKADMLLKWLSFGYEPTGISGFPSQWEVFTHQVKLGNTVEPWADISTPMFFYPVRIGVARASRGARIDIVEGDSGTVVEDVKIAVGRPPRGRFHSLLLQRGVRPEIVEELGDLDMEEVLIAPTAALEERLKATEGDDEQIDKVVKLVRQLRESFLRGGGNLERRTQGAAPDYVFDELDPQAGFARLLSERYETFRRRFAVLRLYESFLRLQALCSYTEGQSVSGDLHQEVMGRQLKRVETPTSIPAVERRSTGPFAVSYRGGIYPLLADTIEEAQWGGAEALQKLALELRPDDEREFVWVVPLSRETTELTTLGFQELLKRLQPAREVDLDEGLSKELREATREGWWDSDSPPQLYAPQSSTDWKPRTGGRQMLEVAGAPLFGTASLIPLRYDQLYAARPEEGPGVAYDLTAAWIYNDKLLVQAQLPLVLKLVGLPVEIGRGEALPGSYSLGLASGLQNLTVSADYFDRRLTLDSPRIDTQLHVSFVTPLRFPLVGNEAAASTYSINGWAAFGGPVGVWHATDRLDMVAGAMVGHSAFERYTGERVSDTVLAVTLAPSVSVRRRWLDTAGLNLHYITREGGILAAELSASQLVRGEESRVTAGFAQVANEQWYYYYSFSFPLKFLRFRKTRWFD